MIKLEQTDKGKIQRRKIMITKIHEFERNGVKNEVYRITNANGAELDILTYGARMIRLTAPPMIQRKSSNRAFRAIFRF